MIGESAPLLVRVAGLPISALEPFGQWQWAEALEACQQGTEALNAVRADLADRLHACVPGSPDSLRRLLLSVRRDCFNGRPLGSRAAEPEWSTLSQLSGGLAERVLQLEANLDEAWSGLTEAYEHQLEREHRHLRDVVNDRAFLRGVAMASPVSVENIHRLDTLPGQDRKETRLESTLLRYVSRAAFKLSPFSTFTRLALGSLRDGNRAACELSSGLQERSLLRLKRYVLDQCWEMVRALPIVRETLAVRLNNTLEEFSPGRYRFLRPGYWALSTEHQAYRFFIPAVVKADLGGPVAAWLLRELRGEWRPSYRELLNALEAAGTPFDLARSTVDRYLSVGFLLSLPPWPANEPCLEDRLARFLREFGNPELDKVAAVLERIVSLEKDFSETGQPGRMVIEIERLADDLWAATAPLSGLPPVLEHGKLRKGNCYEDVFLQPDPRSANEGAVRVSRPAALQALRDLEPMAHVLSLFSHRHEFLLTLDAFLARNWEGRNEVGLLDLFSAINPIWQQYVKFLYAARQAPPATLVFNPLEIEEIEDLHRLRQEVRRALTELLEPAPEGMRVDAARLAALVAGLPSRYTPQAGPCAFLQPLDAAGNLWVVNRLFEGTGRYGSRFTAVMDERARQHYTDHLAARSLGTSEDIELLDLMCSQGDTLNLHAVQTWYVLEMPGETLDLPADRRIRMSDLRVRCGKAGGPPRLVDLSGRLFLPVYLGGAAFDFLPTPLKILSLLGPVEMGSLLEPPSSLRQEKEMKIRERLTLGSTVLLRKRWFIAPNSLPAEVEGLTGAEAFAAINRWRLERGLPERVFFIEKIHHETEKERYKPQYLDFTSPSFVRMFQSSLRLNAHDLTFEEMLPSPEDVSRDGEGQGWALELMLDALALRPPRSSRLGEAGRAEDGSAAATLLSAGEPLPRFHETGVAC